jgi:hypothetical protein
VGPIPRLFVLAGALLAASVTGAFAHTADSATVALSSSRAGARPVALTVALRTELQCGRLRGRSLSVRLPAQARVPDSIPASTVLVGGVQAARVEVSGHTLAIALRRPKAPICTTIAFGTAKIVVTRAARLGNPKAPGPYALAVYLGRAVTTAKLRIRA